MDMQNKQTNSKDYNSFILKNLKEIKIITKTNSKMLKIFKDKTFWKRKLKNDLLSISTNISTIEEAVKFFDKYSDDYKPALLYLFLTTRENYLSEDSFFYVRIIDLLLLSSVQNLPELYEYFRKKSETLYYKMEESEYNIVSKTPFDTKRYNLVQQTTTSFDNEQRELIKPNFIQTLRAKDINKKSFMLKNIKNYSFEMFIPILMKLLDEYFTDKELLIFYTSSTITEQKNIIALVFENEETAFKKVEKYVLNVLKIAIKNENIQFLEGAIDTYLINDSNNYDIAMFIFEEQNKRLVKFMLKQEDFRNSGVQIQNVDIEFLSLNIKQKLLSKNILESD